MGAGRPTKCTRNVTTEICRRLAEGETLRSICGDAHLPCKSTVLLWVVDNEHKEFSDQYMRAREAAGYCHADNVIETTESVKNGSLDPNSAKAIMHGLIWAAERMAPKTHSPRQELTGAGGGPMSSVTYQSLDDFYADQTDAESGS